MQPSFRQNYFENNRNIEQLRTDCTFKLYLTEPAIWICSIISSKPAPLMHMVI